MARKTVSYLDEEDLDFLEPRAPVVTIMGHVDHGKTSLLDYIRKTRVAAGEAGGITQAIGAYQVSPLIGGVATPITFLDTPGHEAFSAMRARGARVTDIAVIMVAADDGVRPQTLEAISHAQAAGVPMVVALNKVDKEGANVERVKQELASAGLVPEEWGGTTPVVPISAKRGTGVDTLLETLLLVAEVAELSANPGRKARGTVVEAYMDRTRGATATLLVQAGTLRVGDCVVCGPAHGRVRALLSDSGVRAQEAGPSTPVQMLGLDCVPSAGDEFDVCRDEEEARERAAAARSRLLAERLVEQSSGQEQQVSHKATLTAGGADSGDEGLKRLNLVLKTDVAGSLEAVRSALGTISQTRVQLRYLLAAAGDVSASDLDLAAASGARVLAFNLTLSDDIQSKAKQLNVDARSYDIIYGLVDEVKLAMEGLLKPVVEKVPLGEAEVRGVFGTGLSGKVAGVMVSSGKLVAKCMVCAKRGKEVIYEGRIESLRRMKDVVKEVGTGYECGVGTDFNGWKEGDILEAYELETKRVILPLVGPKGTAKPAATTV
jgi:translation initiation factor IF-2